MYRGEQPALMGQSFVACDKLTGMHDIVVHLKEVCAGAFGRGRYHVYDHIDAPEAWYEVFERTSHRFQAQIFNTNAQMRRDCVTPYCTVVPHHFNLPCSPRAPGARPPPPKVGLIGWSIPPGKDLGEGVEPHPAPRAADDGGDVPILRLAQRGDRLERGLP